MEEEKQPLPTRGFTDSDKAALDFAREELEEHKHWSWLWGTAGRVIKWILGLVAGLTVLGEAISKVLKAWGTP